MGLFDKKYCDFCGNKIGLLGNKKFEDGNMCKECAAKLSPWFSERKKSNRAELEAQLQYREENRQAVAAFQPTRTIGKNMKLMLDENAGKFMVTSASDLMKANPDVLDFSQVTGCSLDVQESRHELKDKDKDGKSVSFNPPRYEYSYNFYVTIHVNAPYFDEMSYSISNGYIKTGEQPMNTMASSWNMRRADIGLRSGVDRYNEYLAIGNDIKEAVDYMRSRGQGGMMQGQPMVQPFPQQAPQMQQTGFQQAPQMVQPGFHQAPQMMPQTESICPHCNARLGGGAKFCEYCGGQVA
ncbi:MAG: DUF4428 domain-containing protein [Lachnospiraceae bacterium]|nr:DUF4428 domain-containing protein [Lachnospiraceae bacterium]